MVLRDAGGGAAGVPVEAGDGAGAGGEELQAVLLGTHHVPALVLSDLHITYFTYFILTRVVLCMCISILHIKTTLICHFLVVVVVPVSMSMLMTLHWSEAGTNMCWPVL